MKRVKVILKVKKGSCYASKNGHTFEAEITKDGFEVVGVNAMYPEAKVYFNHKEAILFNVQIIHDFHSNNWIGEGVEPEVLTFVRNYCKANKILIK
jgi:hypothetical protein